MTAVRILVDATMIQGGEQPHHRHRGRHVRGARAARDAQGGRARGMDSADRSKL